MAFEIDKIERYFAFIRSQQNQSGVINQSKLDEIGKNMMLLEYYQDYLFLLLVFLLNVYSVG